MAKDPNIPLARLELHILIDVLIILKKYFYSKEKITLEFGIL